jgi:hypothetical protein
MVGEYLNITVLEESNLGLIEAVSLILPGGTEETYEDPQSDYSLSLLRLEPSASRIKVHSLTAIP